MAEANLEREPSHRQIAKCPTGIQGLDEITGGGLPRGRPTLVCGGAGCGKTLLGMEFVVRGAVTYGEPGVFMSFEETSEELAKNLASLGFDLSDLEKQKLLALDFVYIERHEIEETGEYDLEGLHHRGFLPHGHLAAALERGEQRRAQPGLPALEVPGYGSLQPDTGIYHHR
jgi:hypothetical protein